jgi:biopolymer transport protein ExbD
MKFPRNARLFRGHLDAAPFIGVLFCLLIFILVNSLIYIPGVRISLPTSNRVLPGVEGPALAVAMDANGQLIYQNQIIPETNLWQHLKSEVDRQSEPLTLVVYADKAVTVGQFDHLRDLAASAGVSAISQAVLPRAFDSPAGSKNP